MSLFQGFEGRPFVWVSFLNLGFVDFARHFCANVRALGLAHNFPLVIACADAATLRAALEVWPHCFQFDSCRGGEPLSSDLVAYATPEFSRIVFAKLDVVRVALVHAEAAGVGAVGVLDFDVALFADPTPAAVAALLRSDSCVRRSVESALDPLDPLDPMDPSASASASAVKAFDAPTRDRSVLDRSVSDRSADTTVAAVLAQCDEQSEDACCAGGVLSACPCPCAGLVLYRTAAAEALCDALEYTDADVVMYRSEQAFVRARLLDRGIPYQTLDRRLFPNGFYARVWDPQPRADITSTALAVHFNWLTASDKVGAMRAWGVWRGKVQPDISSSRETATSLDSLEPDFIGTLDARHASKGPDAASLQATQSHLTWVLPSDVFR